LNGKGGDASNRLQFYVLGPDLKARGLSEENVMDCIEVVDYDGFVDLVVGHDATHACL
jgi:tRNA 2-thiouridine synthesizing protein B